MISALFQGERKFLTIAVLTVVGVALFSRMGRGKSDEESVASTTANLGTGLTNGVLDTVRTYIPTESTYINYAGGDLITGNQVMEEINETTTNPLPKVEEVKTTPTPTPTPAPTPTPTPTPTPKPTTKNVSYTIKKGDTLWSIAVKYYKNGQKYKQIAKDNNIADPNKIYAGRTITLKNVPI